MAESAQFFQKMKMGGGGAHEWRIEGKLVGYSLNSRDLFLNLRRLVKMTKPFWI